MRQIFKRIENLEKAAGLNIEPIEVLIQFVDMDKKGKNFICSGLRMIPGSGFEQLPASYFNKEEINHDA